MWQIGNTTVRSALRLREGLIALKKSGQEGKIRGYEGELNMTLLLKEAGVIEIDKNKKKIDESIGRKWRGAMELMGFLNPKVSREDKSLQDQIGIFDHISPSGQRLIEAETLSGKNECHLRAMIAYFIDLNDLISRYGFKRKGLVLIDSNEPRYPFIFVLKILAYLEEFYGDSKITKVEMCLIIQCTDPKTNVEDVVSKILNFRKAKENSLAKNFDDEMIANKANEIGLAVGTFDDYSDTAFRYLKATGMVSSKGIDGIAIVPEKLINIKDIIQNFVIPKERINVYKRKSQGASLPTDLIEKAYLNLKYLNKLISKKDNPPDILKVNEKDIKAIKIATQNHQKILENYKEKEFAEVQKNKTEEISMFLEMLLVNRTSRVTRTLRDGSIIVIPKGERAAYFEWTIWRAFLSLNSLTNEPWEARRFEIDQDFLPVNTAPGGGADVIIELQNIILVVEVTFTSSSRQEAAEGEPVRRHVADIIEKYKIVSKKVYGLFIAINVDTNTANTFRLGEWYTKDDKKLALDIVPLALKDFKLIFDAVKDDPSKLTGYFKNFLDDCRRNATELEAPGWKEKINHNCNSLVEKLS